jgi:hypothetical protein
VKPTKETLQNTHAWLAYNEILGIAVAAQSFAGLGSISLPASKLETLLSTRALSILTNMALTFCEITL